MLPRSHKLSAHDVVYIMEKGRVAHSPLFTLRWVPAEGHTRISAIVPKKTAKMAVGRTGLRRKIYHALRELYPRIVSGFKIAVLAKTSATDLTQEEIARGITEAFSKARLIA
ncbi:MAG: ribonuclease P protein component [Patescibacteria group bacterium]